MTAKEIVSSLRTTMEILKEKSRKAYPDETLFYITTTEKEVVGVCRMREFEKMLMAADTSPNAWQ